MTSRHDVMTLIITLALIASGIVLTVTNHMNNNIMDIFVGAVPGVLGYWFGRGGNLSAQDTIAQSPAQPVQTQPVINVQPSPVPVNVQPSPVPVNVQPSPVPVNVQPAPVQVVQAQPQVVQATQSAQAVQQTAQGGAVNAGGVSNLVEGQSIL